MLTLLLLIPNTLGPVLLLEASQGYRLIMGTFPFLALFLCAFMPLLHQQKLKPALILSAASLIVSLALVLSLPLYSDWRPQHLNVHYFEDRDSGEAFYQLNSPNPIPAHLAKVMNFSEQPKQLQVYSQSKYKNWAQSESLSGWPAPELTVINERRNEQSRDLSVQVRSPRGAHSVSLLIPAEAELSTLHIDGQAFAPTLVTKGSTAGYYVLSLKGVYEKVVNLQLGFASTEPVTAYLSDVSTELPEAGVNLVNLRPPLATPVHRGDQAFIMRKLTL